jgi:hypothetical protein
MYVAHWGEIVIGPRYSDGGVPYFSSVATGIYLKHPTTVLSHIPPGILGSEIGVSLFSLSPL